MNENVTQLEMRRTPIPACIQSALAFWRERYWPGSSMRRVTSDQSGSCTESRATRKSRKLDGATYHVWLYGVLDIEEINLRLLRPVRYH
jgi:hypothetical protein